MIKDSDEQLNEDIHMIRSGRVPSIEPQSPWNWDAPTIFLAH